MSDVPPDTTLSTEAGKLSGLASAVPNTPSDDRQPDPSSLGSGGVSMGLADRSVGIAEASSGLAERAAQRSDAAGGLGSEGVRPSEVPGDQGQGMMDKVKGALSSAADRMSEALPGDSALGDASRSNPAPRSAAASEPPLAPATDNIKPGFIDTGGSYRDPDTGVALSDRRGAQGEGEDRPLAGEQGLARALDQAEKVEDISI